MSGMLDAAIAAHPRVWRERYADEVRGTLMDVADDRGGRVPLSETVPLALRGLWMRARGSFTFWGGAVVVAVIIAGTGLQTAGFHTDPAWVSYSLHLNTGLAYALPVIALLSSWLGARSRAARISGAGARLRQLWRDCWPLLAAGALGYAGSIALVLIHSGWPTLTAPSALVLGAQASVVLAATGVGYSLGGVLPRVLVIFVAPAAVGVIVLLLFAWSNPWRVEYGSGYAGLASVPAVVPFLYVTLVGVVLCIVAILVIAIRPLWVRALPIIGVVMVTVVVATTGSSIVNDTAFVQRPQSEFVCSTEEPIVCLWPEQEAAFGDSLRADMAIAYERAVDLGLPVEDDGPQMAARLSVTGTSQGLITGLREEQAVNYYASTFIWDYVEMPEVGDGDSMAVMYSIAILLGVPPETAWPAASDPFTGAPGPFDAREVPDKAAAGAMVDRWLTDGVDGVRAPS